MRITVVAPTVEPVTLGEAKERLNYVHDNDDALIYSCIRAAREAVEERTGLALAAGTYRWLSETPVSTVTRLPLWPVATVTAVVQGDANGGVSTLVVTDGYTVDVARSRLRLVTCPLEGSTLDVTFTVAAPAHVPESLKNAIMLIMVDLVEQRKATIESVSVSLNPTMDWLINPHRVNLGV